jgi:hypothetical protein
MTGMCSTRAVGVYRQDARVAQRDDRRLARTGEQTPGGALKIGRRGAA